MANFYVGSEIKFAIDLTAEGFDMDTDDFDIEVKSSRGSVKGNKGNTIANEGKLVVFEDDGTWYAILDTDGLSSGEISAICTAHIPDANAYDGVRNEIARATLGRLENP